MSTKFERLQTLMSMADFAIHKTNIGKFFNQVEVTEASHCIILFGLNTDKPESKNAPYPYKIHIGNDSDRCLIEFGARFLSISFLDLIRVMNYEFDSFENMVKAKTDPGRSVNYEDS